MVPINQAAKKEYLMTRLSEYTKKTYNKDIKDCTNEEVYRVLLTMTQEAAREKESSQGKKKVYYISAEFLIGKLLSNNLINLGLYDQVKEELEAAGKNLTDIEEQRRPGPSGRLFPGFHGHLRPQRGRNRSQLSSGPVQAEL